MPQFDQPHAASGSSHGELLAIPGSGGLDSAVGDSSLADPLDSPPVDDRNLPDQAYAVFVRSPVAHGNIKNIGLDAAKAVAMRAKSRDVNLPEIIVGVSPSLHCLSTVLRAVAPTLIISGT